MKKTLTNQTMRMIMVIIFLCATRFAAFAVDWNTPQTLGNGDIIAYPITLTGNVKVNVASGTAFIVGKISGDFNFSLTKSGAGELILYADNDYLGETIIENGTLNLVGGIASSTAVSLSSGTAKLVIGGNKTINNLNTTFADAKVEIGTYTLTINITNHVTFAGKINGTGTTGGVTKTGSETFFLTGNAFYDGVTNIQAGDFYLGNSTTGTLTSSIQGNVTISTNASLTIFRNNAYEYTGNISGGGAVLHVGYGTLTLTGNLSYSGETYIRGSTLILGTTTSLASSKCVNMASNDSKLNISSGDKTIKGLSGAGEVILGLRTLTINDATTQAFYGKFTGTGNVIKQGTANFTLKGANETTGSFTASAGTVIFSNKWTGNFIKNAGATLTVDGNATVGGSLTLNGGTGSVNMDLQDYTPSKLTATGVLTVTGTPNIVIKPAVAPTNQVLIQAASGVNAANFTHTNTGIASLLTSNGTQLMLSPIAVSWSGLTANGTSGSVTTTQLTLTFDKDPVTLAASDITVTGATKGALSGSGTTRTLAISNITVANGGNVTVALANPVGYSITPASRTVAVNVATVSWTNLTANGAGGSITTTQLTLTFDKEPVGLADSHITLSAGVTKGALSGSGTTRTLAVSNITLANGALVTVTLTNPPGLSITPLSRSIGVSVALPTLTGTVSITGNAVFGQRLTANPSLTANPNTVTPSGLAYQWRRGSTIIPGTNSPTYDLVQEDIGNVIYVLVTAANCIGNVTSAATPTVTKATPATPAAPTMAGNTQTSITLNTVTGCEYRQGTGAWQSSPEFTGLTQSTSYSFTQRLVATATHFESAISAAASFSTQGPTSVAVTGITVTGAGGATTITTNGGTLLMSAAITPTNASNQAVTWTVTPASGVAVINTSGLLTATGNGTVTVRATAKDGSGVFGEKQITVSGQYTPTAPTITGPTALSLVQGYAATSTDAYTITGEPAPGVTKTSGNASITWNTSTRRLNIAAGLVAGTYPVTLTASNGVAPDATLTFTLTVTPNTAIDEVDLPVLKAWTQNGMLHVSGLTPGQSWRVYNISGQLVYQDVAKTEDAIVPLAAQGVYIVASGGNRVKLIAR